MLKSDPLWYLTQIGHYQSLTIASENLHVTQPTLSIAIKNLEKELNLKLMKRSYNGVVLTAEGIKIAELAEKAFTYFAEIENFAHQAQIKPTWDIAIYSTSALNSVFMPRLVNAYYNQYPDGKFDLHPIGNATPEEAITQNPDAFYLGIFSESRIFDEHIEAIVLDKSKTYLAMSPQATFLPPGIDSISIKDLLHVPLIITAVAEEQAFQNELLNAIRKYGEPNIRFTSFSMDMSSSLVSQTQEFGATLYVSFKNFISPTTSYRLVSIKNTPKFVLTLLYNKKIAQTKRDLFLALLDDYL